MVWNPFKKKSVSISDPQIAKLFGLANDIYAGITVNPNSAMQHATVYSCVTKLTGAIGQMPIVVYKNSDKTKEEAKEGWTKVLTFKPNEFQTVQQWLEQIVLHLCLHGNYYAIVTKNSRGKIVEILPVKPENVDIVVRKGDLIYRVIQHDTEIGERNEVKEYSSDEILHIKNMTYNGYFGMSPIEYCKKSLALSMAAEQHGISFFENSASPSGFLSTDQVLTKDASDRLIKSWNAAHQGVKKAGKVAVLEQNLRFERMGVDNREAQLIESRQYSRSEICGLFGVPAALIGSLEGATFNNTENLILSFHRDTLSPLIRRIEEAIKLHLPDNFEIQLDDTAILRGDSKTQAEVNVSYLMNRIKTPNEIRESLGLAPIDGGDELIEDSSTVRATGTGNNASQTNTDTVSD